MWCWKNIILYHGIDYNLTRKFVISLKYLLAKHVSLCPLFGYSWKVVLDNFANSFNFFMCEGGINLSSEPDKKRMGTLIFSIAVALSNIWWMEGVNGRKNGDRSEASFGIDRKVFSTIMARTWLLFLETKSIATAPPRERPITTILPFSSSVTFLMIQSRAV